jgi:TPR repeat protein
MLTVDRLVAGARVLVASCVLMMFLAGAAAAGPSEEIQAAEARGDFATEIRLLQPFADHGDPAAQCKLGVLYFLGRGARQDYAEAIKWLRRAADQGFAQGQFNLAIIYATGKGAPEDDKEAFKWMRKAADQGLQEAEMNLGLLYAQGKGAAKNPGEAALWFRKAAERGNVAAEIYLADLYNSGTGVKQDHVEAAKWLRKAADQGNAVAQANLATMLFFGKDVPQDYAEAAKWFRKAADQGVSAAQYSLAYAYANGKGVKQDDAEAVRWYRKVLQGASGRPNDQNVVAAQSDLAGLYAAGRGVRKDPAEALRLYKLAAASGFAQAQGALVSGYLRNDPVKVDVVEALKWTLVLVARGDTSAAQALDTLRQSATEDQLLRAKAAAQKEFSTLKLPDLSPQSPGPLNVAAAATAGAPQIPGAAQAGGSTPGAAIPLNMGQSLSAPKQQAPRYTPQFVALHDQPADKSAAVIREIKSQLNTLPAPYLFELARRSFADDKLDGIAWYWVARMRIAYDANRCANTTALPSVEQWAMIAGEITTYIQENPDTSKKGMIEALEREAALPSDTSPQWLCASSGQGNTAGAQGQAQASALKPASQWPAIREALRDQVAQAARQ